MDSKTIKHTLIFLNVTSISVIQFWR